MLSSIAEYTKIFLPAPADTVLPWFPAQERVQAHVRGTPTPCCEALLDLYPEQCCVSVVARAGSSWCDALRFPLPTVSQVYPRTFWKTTELHTLPATSNVRQRVSCVTRLHKKRKVLGKKYNTFVKEASARGIKEVYYNRDLLELYHGRRDAALLRLVSIYVTINSAESSLR